MKKIFSFALVIILLFSSCGKERTDKITHTDWSDPDSYTSYDYSIPPTAPEPDNESEPERIFGISQYNSATNYTSLEDLKEKILYGFTDEMLDNYERRGTFNENDNTTEEERKQFRALLNYLKEKNSIMVPFYKDELVTVFQRAENPTFAVMFAAVTFNKPWIWYYSFLNDKTTITKTMYIDEELVEEANKNGVSWFIKTLSPNYCNLDEYHKNGNSYINSMYESEIPLNDRSVNALIVEGSDVNYDGISIHFIYDNLLVIIRTYPETMKGGFLKELSFRSVPLKE